MGWGGKSCGNAPPLATGLQYIQHATENIIQVMGARSDTTAETLQMAADSIELPTAYITRVGAALDHASYS